MFGWETDGSNDNLIKEGAHLDVAQHSLSLSLSLSLHAESDEIVVTWASTILEESMMYIPLKMWEVRIPNFSFTF
jgi:hypothetical protein